MTPNDKDIETVAVAISIAAGCEPCTRFHLREARNLGATTSQLLQMALVADPGQRDLQFLALGDIAQDIEGDAPRLWVLAGIGTSVCHNNVRSLGDDVRSARQLGVTDEEIMTVVGLAFRIKEKAASHLERIIDGLDADPGLARRAASRCS